MPHRKTLNILVTTATSLLVRASGLATQIITAWYLTPDEFGVYAIALGVTTVTLMMRGGGSGIAMQALRPEEFKTIGGGLFRVGVIFALLGAGLTIAAASPAQQYFDQAQLSRVLCWMALLAVLSHIANYPRAKMASQLKFKAIARIDFTTSIVKLVIAVLCARAGWGAMTFVVSQIAAISLQLVLTSFAAEFRRVDFSAQPNWVAPTAAMLRFPFFIGIMISLMDQVDSFIASFFIPVASLGIYFFSVQMVSQPIRGLIGALNSVLAPYAARDRGHQRLEQSTLFSVFLAGVIFVTPVILVIAAVYPSLQRLLWGSKWQGTVWPVVLTSAFLVYPAMQWVLEGPIIGMRRWGQYLALLSWRTGSKIFGVLAAVLAIEVFALPESAIAVTLVVGIGVLSSITACLQVRKILLAAGSDPEVIDYELFATPAYAILAVVATHGLVSSILPYFGVSAQRPRLEAAIEFTLALSLYGTLSLLLLRMAYTTQLKVVLSILPTTARGMFCRVLFIKDSTR